MSFVLLHPADRGKLAAIMLAMCAIAHYRRREMQKRWLGDDANGNNKFVDHPIVPYLMENASIYGITYCMLRFSPKLDQNRPLFTYLVTMVAISSITESLMMWQKFCAAYLYEHVPYFPGPSVPSDNMFKEYVTCNVFSLAVGAVLMTKDMIQLPTAEFHNNLLNPAPLRLFPYLGKFIYCRVVTDIVFGVAHRAMHEYPSLYTAIHKRHHEHNTPRTQTNFHFGVIDFFIETFLPINAAFASMKMLGVQMNQIEQFCLFTPLAYFESVSHTGKEIPNATWFPLLSPLVDWITGCDQRLIEYHTKHHQLYRCNYSISPWFDKLCGTYRMEHKNNNDD